MVAPLLPGNRFPAGPVSGHGEFDRLDESALTGTGSR